MLTVKSPAGTDIPAIIQYNKKYISNYLTLRRYLDLIIIFVFLPMILPIFLSFSIILYFHFKGKIIFTQKRAGYLGKPFIMYKFKTMLDNSNGEENYLHHNMKRETKLGAFLRKHRIDEIPQFFNIIKGDMSLIGPRPEAFYHYEYFSEKIENYQLRKTIPQGLTGLAQISYPYTDTIEGTIEKLKYDLLYIDNLSFKTDIKIIFQTFIHLLSWKNSN